MEKYKDNPIWQVISFVGNNKMTEAVKMCKKANVECDTLKNTINIQHKKAVSSLKSFLSAVEHNQLQRGQLEAAWNEFQKNVIPHYQREEEQKQTKKTENKVHSSQQDERTPKFREDVNLVAHRFRHIFDGESWAAAHEELGENSKLSEKEKAEYLLEVVDRAFRLSETEADRQLSEAELCAYYIVKNGKLPEKEISSEKMIPPTPTDLLRRYRYLNAHLSTSRLIKVFQSDMEKKFYKKHKLKPCRVIDKYATTCLEVSWLLCTEDPQVHMVLGKESDNFDEDMYTQFTRKGKKIDFIVWPALQHYKNGPVLAKGAAECKN